MRRLAVIACFAAIACSKDEAPAAPPPEPDPRARTRWRPLRIGRRASSSAGRSRNLPIDFLDFGAPPNTGAPNLPEAKLEDGEQA